MFIARAVCGATHVTAAALFCSSSLLCISNSDWMKLNGQKVLTVMKSPSGDICHQYSSVVTAIIRYSRTIKLQYTLLGDYWLCVRPTRLPVLTWVPSSVPRGNNFQDTFLIGSATDTTEMSKPDNENLQWSLRDFFIEFTSCCTAYFKTFVKGLLLNAYVWKMEMDTVTSLSGLSLMTVIGRIKFSHINCESEALKLYA